MRCFTEALRLVRRLNVETATENFRATRSVLGFTHPDNTIFFRVDEHDASLCIETAAAHARDRKQSATSNGRAFYLYAALLLQELKSTHSTACEKHLLNFNAVLLTKTPMTKISSLPVRKMSLTTRSLFSCKPADKKL